LRASFAHYDAKDNKEKMEVVVADLKEKVEHIKQGLDRIVLLSDSNSSLPML
jgi:hypothetical protein